MLSRLIDSSGFAFTSCPTRDFDTPGAPSRVERSATSLMDHPDNVVISV
jgi:hypothetical protein